MEATRVTGLESESRTRTHYVCIYEIYTHRYTHTDTHIVIYISVCYQEMEAVHKLKNRRMVKLNLIMHPMDK